MFRLPVTLIPFGYFYGRPGSSGLSVLFCESTGDVHGVEQDEDVGLQELDQELQEADRDEEQPGQEADRLHQGRSVEQEVLAADREQDDQQVAGEHVREETEGQR